MKPAPFDFRRGGASLAVMASLWLAGCGGSADVAVVGGGPALGRLSIAVAQVGPNTVRVDWSDDPRVAVFTVFRDGFVLADVDALSLIDTTVRTGNSYCYHVDGFDDFNQLVSASDSACVTVFP